MTIMKVSNPEDLEKWKRAIETLEITVRVAEQETVSLNQFYSNEFEVAQFWKRYALEKTNDTQLRKIAESNMKVVLMFETQLDALKSSALRDAIKWFKNNISVTI